MEAARKRPTGFFTRLKQAVTGHDSEEVEEHRRKLDKAIKELNHLLALGKISQAEADERIKKLTESNGAQG
jgi:hypothetical protein